MKRRRGCLHGVAAKTQQLIRSGKNAFPYERFDRLPHVVSHVGFGKIFRKEGGYIVHGSGAVTELPDKGRSSIEVDRLVGASFIKENLSAFPPRESRNS